MINADWCGMYIYMYTLLTLSLYTHTHTHKEISLTIITGSNCMEGLNQGKVELGHWTYKIKNEMDIIKLGKPNHKAQNGEMTRRMSVSLSNLNRDCL